MGMAGQVNAATKGAVKDSALSLASYRGHNQLVELLLSAKADVEYQNQNGETALIWASENGQAPTVRTLIANKANLETRTNEGVTALMWAAEAGHNECITALLEAGAAVNAACSNGKTALIHSVHHLACHSHSIPLLLAAKADVHVRSSEGDSALVFASARSEEAAALLKAAGAQLTAADDERVEKYRNHDFTKEISRNDPDQ